MIVYFVSEKNYLYWKRSISNGVIRLSDIVDAAYYDKTKKKDVDRGIVFKRKLKIKKSKKYKS